MVGTSVKKPISWRMPDAFPEIQEGICEFLAPVQGFGGEREMLDCGKCCLVNCFV